ncbi:unnamed protein product, partial [Closterium sp. NIES-53]
PSALRLPVLLATAHSSVYRPLVLSSTFGRVRRAEWSVPGACRLPHVLDDVHMTSPRVPSQPPGSLRGSRLAPKGAQGCCKEGTAFLCSTSGMGLLLGGRGPDVLTGHADASWVEDSATQRLSQGYNFSLRSGYFSWRSTQSSSVLSSSCEAEIYAGAMAVQELRWLTYMLNDLQRGQLCLACAATRANTADIFTKALPNGDHQRFSTVSGLVPTLPHLLIA